MVKSRGSYCNRRSRPAVEISTSAGITGPAINRFELFPNSAIVCLRPAASASAEASSSGLLGLSMESRTAKDLPWKLVRLLPAVNHRHSIHQHVLHPHGELIRLFERGPIRNFRWIEHHDIRPHALFEHASIRQSHSLSRQRAEFANRLLQPQLLFLAHILP